MPRRRKIRLHNPLVAIVRSPLFRKRIEKKLKGRASYSRKRTRAEDC